MTNLHFRVLGPVQVMNGETTLRITGRTTLTLLASLLVMPNQIVSVDKLTEWIWADSLPDNPRGALQNGVSRLRQLIGKDRLLSYPWGYSLRVGAENLDLLEYRRLCATAKAATSKGDPTTACAALESAVGLWSGQLLENIESSVLRAEVASALTEEYMITVEAWAELTLRLDGPLDAIIGELRALVRQHPFRESSAACLMLLLARSGCPGEALMVYSEIVRQLREELGVTPAAQLRNIHARILGNQLAH